MADVLYCVLYSLCIQIHHPEFHKVPIILGRKGMSRVRVLRYANHTTNCTGIEPKILGPSKVKN